MMLQAVIKQRQWGTPCGNSLAQRWPLLEGEERPSQNSWVGLVTEGVQPKALPMRDMVAGRMPAQQLSMS